MPARDTSSCSGIQRQWRDNRPTIAVTIAIQRCGSLEAAREVQWIVNRGFPRYYGTIQVPPAVPGAIQGYGSPFLGWPAGQYQLIDFRRGVYFVQVAAFLASSRDGSVSTLARSAAMQQWRVLSGPPGTGAESFPAQVTDGLPEATVVIVTIAMAIRSLVGFARGRHRQPAAARRRWEPDQHREEEPDPPRVLPEDVTGRASRASAQGGLAAALWVPAAACAAGAFGLPFSRTAAIVLAVTAVAAAGGAVALAVRAAGGLRRLRARRASPAVTLWCLAALALYATGALTLTAAFGMGGSPLAVRHGRLDPTIVMNGALGRLAATLPLQLAVADCFAIAALAVAAGYLCARQACLRMAATGHQRHQSSLAKIVYLPGPGNERLTIRTGTAGRRPLASKLTFGFSERFGDLAARLLAPEGPIRVAGVVPPGWPDGGLIVIDAAPPAGHPGPPELADQRMHEHLDRVLLLLPPLKEDEIYARWQAFRERNLPYVRLPAIGVNTGRLLVLRHRAPDEWTAWHARRRSDAAYAAALSDASQSGAGLAPQPGTHAAMPQATSPAPMPQAVPPAPVPQAVPSTAVPQAAAPIPMPGPAREEPAPTTPAQGGREAPPPNAAEDSEAGGPLPGRWSRRRIPAGWLAAAGAVLLVAVNAVSVPVTELNPGPVTAAVSQALLPAGALGAAFTPAQRIGPPTVPLAAVSRNGVRCTQRSRAWAASGNRVRIQVELTGCSPPGIIKDVRARIGQIAGRARTKAASGIPYAVEIAGKARIGGTVYQVRRVVFRSEEILVDAQLLTRSPPASADVRTFLRAVRQQEADLPGAPEPGLSLAGIPAHVQVAVNLYAEAIVLAVFVLVLVNWLARRRMSIKITGPSPRSGDRVIATDVRGQARRLARLARGRFAVQAAGLYVAALSISFPRYRLILACAGAAIFAAATAVRPQGAVRPLRERSKSGVLTGRRTFQAVSLVVVSLVSVCLVLVMPLFGFLLWSLRRSDIVAAYGRIDPGLLGPSVARVIGSVPLPVLSADCFVIAVAAAVTVPVSYLAARRIAALTADEVSRGGTGEPKLVLYLRNFADDDIPMPTSRLSRNSVIERIAVYRSERFEEVLVRHLSGVAPVIAVDPPGIRKRPIGAARVTISGTNWRSQVEPLIAKAELIVVGAAPQAKTEGLGWELAEIARAEALPKTLFVLPPLLPSTVHDRWDRFVRMATPFELPPDLTPWIHHHLVLAQAGPGRWRTWHSRRRTEWDYAAALRQAVRSLGLGIGDRAGSGHT